LGSAIHQEAEDFVLGGFLVAFVFAAVDEFGVGVGEGEDFGGDETVVEDDVGGFDAAEGAEG
jgi:hypothetical protein